MCPPQKRRTDMERSENILAEARRWLGTPYHHHARVHQAGVDCAQLLYAVYVESLGLVPLFEIDDYPADWMMHRSEERFLSYILDHAEEVSTPMPGDIAMFKWGRCFAHGAIVSDWPVVIHADIRAGRVSLDDASQGRFAGREVKFFRIKEAL